MPSITPTSCAILGLIAVEEGSAYELVQRMQNNYRFFWPRAQSHFYAEVKMLVGSGLATAADERVGRRPRTVYRITQAGRRAIIDWLDRPAAPPTLECEGLLRIAYADFGSKAQLIGQLEGIRAHAHQVLEVGARIARDYAAGRVKLPQRAHTSHLTWHFLWTQHQAQAQWAAWAIEEVRSWSGTRSSRATLEQARRFFAGIVGSLDAGPPDAGPARSGPASRADPVVGSRAAR
jgi:DNA-binding PadR family transcriptional regulator